MNGIHTNVCKRCGRVLYPRHSRCPACDATGFDVGTFQETATLITYTRVHMLSLAYADLYITLGIVEFADGTRALGRVDVAEPEVGMKLRAGMGVVRSDGLNEIEGLRFTQP